jgi:hypothetical protein
MCRKVFLTLSLLTLSFIAFAGNKDEGMWLPMLLKKLNEADMKAKGFKLNAEDLYSINKSSLKDAVVSFGGFCTGEMISPEGLLLTNHHCGYGQIQKHSSVQNDYLTNGFWAMTREQELPNPGLTATFIVRMEDVTTKVLANIDYKTPERERQARIAQNITKLEQDAVADSHYQAIIRPFFNGNEYYLFITEVFRDVRLVGTPPSAIGKFGGDTDNWMWPRHTGDFSVFRIYAGKDGLPAEYSKDNVPYKPKHHFPISLKGVNKGDFTFVYGFPGRTQEYLTSHAVKLLVEESNPHKIKIREKKLALMDEDMKASDEVRIQYASKYANVANYYKKWMGETRGLRRLNAVQKKQQQEEKFSEWVKSDASRKEKYGNLLSTFNQSYANLAKVNLANDYFREAVMGIELLTFSNSFNALLNAAESNTAARAIDRLKAQTTNHFKDYNLETDKKIFAALLQMYYQNVPKEFHPAALTEAVSQYKGNFTQYAADLYTKSALVSGQKTEALLASADANTTAILVQDPAFRLMNGFMEVYQTQILPVLTKSTQEIELASRSYMAALREMHQDKKFYPDANSTLRVTYGKVADYQPMDGVQYTHFTTLEGVMEKEDPTVEEFVVPAKLKELYQKKDYGIYGKDGVMPVCFIATNHTTGGNSGSPVLNAEGHLIGTNFDRNWEGTMSDIMYDPDQVRNITVDIRYTLFVIDKFAGAGHLIKEMTIIR